MVLIKDSERDPVESEFYIAGDPKNNKLIASYQIADPSDFAEPGEYVSRQAELFFTMPGEHENLFKNPLFVAQIRWQN